MKELYFNISVVTWVLIIILIMFILNYLYDSTDASNTLNNRNNVYRWKNYDEFNNENRWYGLNSSGNYRGYGREYGGPNTPRYVYGYMN